MLLLAALPCALLFPVRAEDVLVRASGFPEDAFRRSASATVLGREEIAALQARSLPDLLGRVAGVATTTNGSFGQAASASIRGSEARHVLVLVDGAPIGDPSSVGGAARLESVPLGDVRRVEVLRGPLGAIHGPQAMGGVVSISTGGPARGSSLSLGYGSFGRAWAGVRASSGAGRWSWGVSAEGRGARGVSAWPEWKGPGADRDGSGSAAVAARIGRAGPGGGRLDASFRLWGSVFEYDDASGDNPQRIQIQGRHVVPDLLFYTGGHIN